MLFDQIHNTNQSDDEDCQDYDDRLRSANIYCFRAELSAEGAKRGVESLHWRHPPEVFPPDDLPRPSRPKAGLGLVMMMMMMMMVVMMMMYVCLMCVLDQTWQRLSEAILQKHS